MIKFTRKEKLGLIPLVGIYWELKYNLGLHVYHLILCFFIGATIANFI